MKYTLRTLSTSVLLLLSPLCIAGGLADISNFRQYNPGFASSGQPSTEQLKLVADSGVERVIYLAFTDNETAIEDEDRTVKSLGMDYIHIPVDFDQPTLSDYQQFAAVMHSAPGMNTLLHCQINLRASAFSFLYRVIQLNIPMRKAIEDLQGVWAPNKDWYLFIKKVLKHHGFEMACDGCDWGAVEFSDQS